jgi:enamine deaminase RidA (YjgF/YER057c/UK114 family)
LQADEIAVLYRPDDPKLDAARQAEMAYGALVEILAAQHAAPQYLTTEALFLRDIRRDLPRVLAVRERIFAENRGTSGPPGPAFIGQAPLDASARFELLVSAVIPHRRDIWSVRDVAAAPSCACTGCARSGARVVQLGEQISLHTSNVHGGGSDAVEQAWNTLCALENLLQLCGMGFGDVQRIWIHLRDIDRDYDALNRARREFFRQRGIAVRPASTGIQGDPLPDVHDFAMSCYAVKSTRPSNATPMSSPSLNEAWSYGADFSRGLRLVEVNKVALYLSGTASIDEAGRTIHSGNFAAQAERMLHNIESLLAQQGATFDHLISGVVYLRNADDAPALRALLDQRGGDGFPCAMVQANLCRPDLLCELEGVAMLPHAIERA